MFWSKSRSRRSVEEGRAIIAAARRAGVTLMVGHVERFNPAVEAIKEAIRGEDILSIAITRVGPFPPRMSNVGVVIDLAVHDIDLIRWFTDSEIIEVQPQLSSAVAEREDIALLQFRTASGVLAHINTNWLTPFKARNVTVATRGKYVMGDLLTRQVTECFGFQPDGSYSMRHLSVGYAEPLRAELLHSFMRSARAPPAVTGEEGVASLEIATRCLDGQTIAPAHRTVRRAVLADRQCMYGHYHECSAATSSHRFPLSTSRHSGRGSGPPSMMLWRGCWTIASLCWGRRCATSKSELAAFCGARHVISCASGTDALVMALTAKGIGPGDAVFCPAFTFCATAEVVALVGATPVFVDVDATTFNIDPQRLARRGRQPRRRRG